MPQVKCPREIGSALLGNDCSLFGPFIRSMTDVYLAPFIRSMTDVYLAPFIR
jgi:hypothetical protein